MLQRGDLAPDFALQDQDGRVVTLDVLIAGGPLILFFYPSDFTPICTREACLFRDAGSALSAAGVAVAGISPNDSDSHSQFRDAHSLGYTLLADPKKEAARAFGVAGPFGFGMRRATFLIDPDKRIRHAVRADLRLGPHNALLHEALSAAAKPA